MVIEAVRSGDPAVVSVTDPVMSLWGFGEDGTCPVHLPSGHPHGQRVWVNPSKKGGIDRVF